MTTKTDDAIHLLGLSSVHPNGPALLHHFNKTPETNVSTMSWLFGYSTPAPEPPPPPPKPSATMARRERTDEGPTFTSRKCPPGPGLENSCELPFGFVWTPLAEIPKRKSDGEAGAAAEAAASAKSNTIPVIECPTSSLPPVLCLTCLTYLNPHVEVKYSTGIWTCSLCGAENVLPKRLLGAGGLLTPALASNMVEYHQPLPLPPNEEDVCSVILVVDANLDPADAKGIVKAVEQVLPGLLDSKGTSDDEAPHPKIQLGLVVFDQAVALYQLGIAGVASADIYTADDDDEAREKALESRAYLQTITSKADLESLSQCLSAVFGVSVDASSKSSVSRMEILRQKKEARQRQEQLQQQGKPVVVELPKESPWIQKRTTVKATKSQRRCTGEALKCAMDLASVQESRTSRVLLFTNGCPNIGEGSVVAEGEKAELPSPLPKKTQKNKKSKHDVVDKSQMSKAIEYYEALANLGIEAGIAVDVFCAGAMELGLPAYQALVDPSGGYVLPHSTFDSPHLVHNLTYCLKYTYVSRTTSEIPIGKGVEVEQPKTGLARFFSRKAGPKDDDSQGKSPIGCIVDIRTDSFIAATHLVGPGELVDSSSFKDGSSRLMRNERAAFAEGSKLAASKDIATNKLPSVEALDLSLTRIRLARFDPLATMSVMVQVNESMIPEDDEYAFFQTTVRYISRDGKSLITRVCTHRFEVAESVSDYVKNVDNDVVSVLLAKGAVYRSLHGREETEDIKDKIVAGDTETLEQLAYDSQLDLDCTVQRISGAFRLLGLEENTRKLDLESGREEKKDSSSPSSLDFAFPPQLSEGLKRLYHLRRGALISPGPMRSMDDRAEMRHLFLRFPLEDCVGMMAPKLWSTGNLEKVRSASSMGAMHPFPAETMALWDASIIACDQHDVQFVWSGKACTESNPFDSVREKFQKYLKDKAKDRFPMPEIHMLFDGDSMSRRFTTRLAPSHADSPDQQLANFPQLSTLSPAALESLRSRFRFYDAASDASFRKWFWSVSSATHASRDDGVSLCE